MVDDGDTAAAIKSTKNRIRVFESYGWRDAADIAARLKSSLDQKGYTVWIDREHMKVDEEHFAPEIEEALQESEIVVALLSPHSVRGVAHEERETSKCYNEIRIADKLRRPIVPVMVQEFNGAPPFLLIIYRMIDWLQWQEPGGYQRGVDEIVRTIERKLAGDKDFDSAIVSQVTNFATELATARGNFTGRSWLFERIGRWLEKGRPCFRIEGASGSGKTAIAAELVRRNPDGRVVAYHFCSAASGTLEPIGFVHSISGMLASSIPEYGKRRRAGDFADELAGSDPARMLAQGVLEPLSEIRMNGHFTIVVDALDEAIASGQAALSIPELLGQALAFGKFPPWLKLLVTTRPHGRIEKLFGGAETCVLGESIEDQRADLRAYIELQLAEPALAAIIAEGERERAARLIEDRAQTSFQYASVVLSEIRLGQMTLAEVDQLRPELKGLYYNRANQRFPDGSGYDKARLALGVLLAAREPLPRHLLAILSGLDEMTDLRRTMDSLSCFIDADSGEGGNRSYRIAHASIRDWLLSDASDPFTVDAAPSRERLLAHCLAWRTNHEPYAMKHVIGHLLEVRRSKDALQMVADGLFAEREARLNKPALDIDDSRSLTLALIGEGEKEGILKLARTENIGQRDGVASGLQSARAKDDEFVGSVVSALLKLKP